MATKKATKTTKFARPATKRAPKQVVAPIQPKATSDDAVRLAPDLSRYHHSDIKTPSGRKTLDVGDDTAVLLRGKTLDEAYALTAKALKEDEHELRARYAKLNPGMQRMNLGNRLRAKNK